MPHVQKSHSAVDLHGGGHRRVDQLADLHARHSDAQPGWWRFLAHRPAGRSALGALPGRLQAHAGHPAECTSTLGTLSPTQVVAGPRGSSSLPEFYARHYVEWPGLWRGTAGRPAGRTCTISTLSRPVDQWSLGTRSTVWAVAGRGGSSGWPVSHTRQSVERPGQ